MSKIRTKKMIASVLAAVLTLGGAGIASAQRHDRDETGRLLGSLGSMQLALRELVSQVRTSACRLQRWPR